MLNQTLCRGELGNLDLLLQAADTLGDPILRSRARQMARAILDDVDQHGWWLPVPLGVGAPGLMAGLAGMGYRLPPLADPARIPSVLLLELPGHELTNTSAWPSVGRQVAWPV